MGRIMIAGDSSSSGKTTITCGLLRVLQNRNIKLSSFKCGPDYIDPMFHKRVLKLESRNLDLFLNDENTVKYLLDKNSINSDISLIEGVMGFYDGVAGKTTIASSYDLARVTSTPVILVVNCRGKATSIVAQIKGYVEYRDDSNIRGVILNNMSPMLYGDIKELIEDEIGIHCLGYVPRSPKFTIESRHLGLVVANEILDIDEKINSIADLLEDTINIDKIIEISKLAGETQYISPRIKKLSNVKIGVARDNAFCFYYEDNLDLLREMGASIIEFSPLKDKCLPSDISAIYIGGGYPELYGETLSSNIGLLNEIKMKLNNGMPCLAECGGFMYLTTSIEDTNSKPHKMVDFFHSKCFKTDKLSRFGYITLSANKGNMLCSVNESINAHEFHYWDCTENGEVFTGSKPKRERKWQCINQKNNVSGGFPHIHFYSNINVPINFLTKAIEYNKNIGG
ncbi:MAG: cobyrinate a,c-diamide synthase [Clostridium sp.]